MTLTDIFLIVLEMSAKALSTAIIALLCMFLLSFIRRVPKRISYAIMFVVIFRMICPVSISSSFSIFNLDFLKEYGTRATPAGIFTNDVPVGNYEIAIEGTQEFDEAINTGLIPPKNNDLHFDYVNYIRDSDGNIAPAQTVSDIYSELAAKIWLGGVILFWGYGAVTYFLLKRKVSTATIVEGNVFETDRISVPFILGFIRPKIYLPLGLSEDKKKYVICHEKMHLLFGDNIIKIVVYLAMSVHWFNLLLWLWFYRIFMMLMEQACDESVLHRLGEDAKADYSETLLSLSSARHFIGTIPVAFGEGYIKDRIHDILKYKKPAVFLTAFAIVLSVAAVAVCGTNDFVYDKSVIEWQNDGSASNNTEIFKFIPGKNVRSVAFTFEIWTEEGLYYSQRLSGGTLKGMQFAEENTITVSHHTDDKLSSKSLTMTLDLNGTAYINTDTVALPYSKPLIGKGTTHIGYTDGKPYNAETDSITALCAVVFTPGKWHTSTGDCTAISTTGKIEVEYGCVVALIRMETSSKYTPRYFYNMTALIPWLEKTESCTVFAGDTSREVTPGAIMNYISALETSQYFDFGNTNIDGEFTAEIMLRHSGSSSNLYFDKGGYIYISTEGSDTSLHLYKILPNQQQYGRILIEIYNLLGIKYNTANIYGLPNTPGQTAIFNGNETTLLSDFQEYDTALYGFSDSDLYYIMLRHGSELYTDYLEYKPVILETVYNDYDSDGNGEIAFIGSAPPEDDNDNYFFMVDLIDEKLSVNTIFDCHAQLDMLIDWGTYIDNEKLIYIFYDGYDLNGNLSYTPDSFIVDVSKHLAEAGKSEFEAISVYHGNDIYFWFENGKMRFSSGIYLDFDDSHNLILCGTVSGDIVYNDCLTLGQLTLKATSEF